MLGLKVIPCVGCRLTHLRLIIRGVQVEVTGLCHHVNAGFPGIAFGLHIDAGRESVDLLGF